MSLQTKVIGRQPTDHGPYDPNLAYGKKFQCTLFGCAWESLHDNNNTAPAVWDGGDTITPNPVDWKKVSGSYEAWLMNHDKPAVSEQYPFNGMGRVKLQKNIVNGVNTLTQAMLTQQNTIYVIQYDFTLGEDITVPANCILEFDGGSISASGSNDTVTGSNTQIKAKDVAIFTGLSFAGTWNVPYITAKWLSDPTRENALTQLFNLTNENVDNTVDIPYGVYNVSTDVVYGRVIKLNSNTHIILNGTIQLVNSYFRGYSIIDTYNAENIIIEGSGKIIGNNDSMPSGIDGEFGFGIWVEGYNTTIKGIEISKCWGDGIMVGQDVTHTNPAVPEFPDETTNNVRILDCHIHDCRRQGISIVNCKNAIIDSCTIYDISGTAPQNGIDIEPIYSFQYTENIKILHCDIYNTTGEAIQITDNTGTYTHITNVVVDSNNIHNISNRGIMSLHGRNITIHGNYIENTGASSIHIGSERTTITGNTIKNLTPAGSANMEDKPCILIANLVNNCRVSENYATGNGYFMRTGSRTTIENNVVDVIDFMYNDAGGDVIQGMRIIGNNITATKFSCYYYYANVINNDIACSTIDFGTRGYLTFERNKVRVNGSLPNNELKIPFSCIFRDNYLSFATICTKLSLYSRVSFVNNNIIGVYLAAVEPVVAIRGNLFVGNNQTDRLIEVESDNVIITDNMADITNTNSPVFVVVQVTTAKSIIVAYNIANDKIGNFIQKASNTTCIVTAIYNRSSKSGEDTYLNVSALTKAAGLPVQGTALPSVPNGIVHEFFNTIGALNKPLWYNGGVWLDASGYQSVGDTTSRPSGVYVGFKYYDTQLGKIVVWNGTDWVDA